MGAKRHCVQFKKVKVRTTKDGKATTKLAFRCVDFKQGRGHPKCTPGKLAGGGRSQVFIRPRGGPCVGSSKA